MNTSLEARLIGEVIENSKTLSRIEERLEQHLKDDAARKLSVDHRKEVRRASLFSIVAMLISALGVWARFLH